MTSRTKSICLGASLKSTGDTQRWFRPDMTARLLTGALTTTHPKTLPEFVYNQELSHDNVAHL